MPEFDPKEAPDRLSADAGERRQTMEFVRTAFKPQAGNGAAPADSIVHRQSQTCGASEVNVAWRAEEEFSKPFLRLAEKASHVLFGMSIFLCGALLGLFAGEGVRGQEATSASSTFFSTSMPADGTKLPRGIARDELPYDGMPVSGISTPSRQQAEKDDDLVSDNAVRQSKGVVRRPAATLSPRSLKGASRSSTRPSVGRRGDTEEKSAPLAQEGSPAEKSGNRSTQHSESNSRNASKPNLVSATTVKVREGLARCERADNLFSRETCKWRICNGRWGKHGCPSFRQQPHYF